MLLVFEASLPVLAPTVLRACPEHPLFCPAGNPTEAGLSVPLYSRGRNLRAVKAPTQGHMARIRI